MGTTGSDGGDGSLARRGRAPRAPESAYRRTFAVGTLSLLLVALAQTMVVPAVPTFERAYDTPPGTATWLLTAFMITSVVCTPLLGRLGDLYGKRRMILVSLGLFGLGSLVAALAPSFGVLIAARAIQGGGAALFPLTYGLVRDTFPPDRVTRAIGALSGMLGVGTGAGLVLAGPIVDAFGLSGIFWVLVVLTTGTWVAVWRWVPESPVRAQATLDVLGGLLLSAGLGCLLLAVSQGNHWGWSSGRVLGLLAAAVALVVVWVRWELHTKDPLVDIALLRERAVWSTNACQLAFGFTTSTTFFLVPQLVQTPTAAGYGFGATITASGLFMLPRSVVTFLAGPLSGFLSDRFTPRVPLALGLAAASLTNLWLGLGHGSEPLMYVQNGVLGLCTGLALAAMANMVVAAVPREVTGIALGMNSVFGSIGSSLASQVAIAFVTAHTIAGGFPAESGYTLAFCVCAGVAACGLAGTALIPRARRGPLETPLELPPEPVAAGR
jgi:MFS family permease